MKSNHGFSFLKWHQNDYFRLFTIYMGKPVSSQFEQNNIVSNIQEQFKTGKFRALISFN